MWCRGSVLFRQNEENKEIGILESITIDVYCIYYNRVFRPKNYLCFNNMLYNSWFNLNGYI